MDCTLPGSSVHGISQARTLEWVDISFSRGSSWPRDWTCVSCIDWLLLMLIEFPRLSALLKVTGLRVPVSWHPSQNCGKFLKRWKYQTTLPASWEICTQVKKQQLEPDMEQQTGSKLGKEYVKAVCCHPAYLTYMLSTSCKMPDWMKHKLDQDCWEKYQ